MRGGAVVVAAFAAAAAAAGDGCDCGSADAAQPCTGTSVTQTVGNGTQFAFTFSCGGQACACGRFLTGDYWVAATSGGGAVTVTGAPHPSGPNDGLAINPSGADGGQGLLPCAPQSYKAALNKIGSLPLTATPGTSLFRVQMTPDGHCDGHLAQCCVGSSAVLTVLGAVPRQCGATTFRPNWAGSEKGLWDSEADFDLSALPSSAAVSAAARGAPGAETHAGIVEKWAQPTFDLCGTSGWGTGNGHGCGSGGAYQAFVPRWTAAAEGDPFYGSSTRQAFQEGVLLVMDDAPVAGEKAAALHALIQRGIDLYGQKESAPGVMWQASAGENDGRKLPVTFFAALVTDAAVRAKVGAYNATVFQETSQISVRAPDGAPMWGDPHPVGGAVDPEASIEDEYWNGVIASSCFLGADQGVAACGKTPQVEGGHGKYRDPYGLIDGPSNVPGGGYCHVTAATGVTYSLIMRLMPAIEAVEPFAGIVHDYAARVSTGVGCGSFGVRAAPDPCAPPTARDQQAGCQPLTGDKCVDYGVTWGPDKARPGHCIEHGGDPMAAGRFSNHASDTHPFGYMGPLAKMLLPCRGPAPPPAPATPAPAPRPPSPAPAHPTPAPAGAPTPAPPPPPAPPVTPPPGPAPAGCAAALAADCASTKGAGTPCKHCVKENEAALKGDGCTRADFDAFCGTA